MVVIRFLLIILIICVQCGACAINEPSNLKLSSAKELFSPYANQCFNAHLRYASEWDASWSKIGEQGKVFSVTYNKNRSQLFLIDIETTLLYPGAPYVGCRFNMDTKKMELIYSELGEFSYQEYTLPESDEFVLNYDRVIFVYQFLSSLKETVFYESFAFEGKLK